MKIYKVSPILKYSPFFSLTYISKFEFSVGNLVQIDFNKRKIFAIILEVYNLKDAKVEIRKGDFFTKKIESKLDKKVQDKFSKKQFSGIKRFSDEFAIPVGEIIFYLFGEEVDLGNNVFEKMFEFKKGAAGGRPPEILIKDFNFEKYLLPTSPHISRLHLFFVWLENFGGKTKLTIESSFFGVNEKYFLDNLKKEKKFDLQIKESEHKAKKYLVNVKKDDEVINKEILEKIKENVFVFVLEQAYASRVFCNDCKKSYDCENCGHAYSVLHEKDEMFLYCKNCKNKKVLKKDQYLICKHCGSWRVFPFGTGVQKVKEFLIEKGYAESLENKKIIVGSIKELNKQLTKNKIFDQTIVASLGPLVKGKNFDSDVKLIYLLSKLENISKEIYINKREGDEISLDNYKNKEKFVEEELKLRKISGLPPFGNVVTLIFNYKNKKVVDKFLAQDFEKLKQSGEIKKGNNYIYYWLTPRTVQGSEMEWVKYLRNFGDLIVSNTIIEQSISSKK